MYKFTIAINSFTVYCISAKEVFKITVSKKQQASVNKYVKENYDRILVTMPKGKKDIIKAHVDTEQNIESVNGFINRAIDETLERDKRMLQKESE